MELRWGPRGENSFGQMLQIGVKLVIYAGKIAFFGGALRFVQKSVAKCHRFKS